MQEFTQAILSKKENQLSINELEPIVNEFPYFQFAKSILLKKYRTSEHFKYNSALKSLAANTINREVLFDYISQIEEDQIAPIPKTEVTTNISTKGTQEQSIDITQEVNKPLQFTTKEKHSFSQWLQLNHQTPVQRVIAQNTEISPLDTKLNTIDQFLLNNPKITPVKKTTSNNTSIKRSIEENSSQLMTETLAKVYIAQKKYNDAIQAYKILSLKYPEKSTFFADQIKKIEILQKNIS